MTPRTIKLSAPSRLHFGLFSIGQTADVEFGGVGLMIEAPRTNITVRPSERLRVVGPDSDDCRKAIINWFATLGISFQRGQYIDADIRSVDQLPVEVEIESLPTRHCGLGSGTQLALCATTAITQLLGLTQPGPSELSAAVGRGKRSAIGSYGFFSGGFLVDRGKSPADLIAPLDFRTDFPEHWPVMIVLQKGAVGVSGSAESIAFEQLPPTTVEERQQMIEIVREEMIPAIIAEDYDRFGESVYQFGRQSGMQFGSVQGGPYNGEIVADLVASIRSFGVPAVGQTSWGPGVFAIVRNQEAVNELKRHLTKTFPNQFEILITRADNRGVRLNH